MVTGIQSSCFWLQEGFTSTVNQACLLELPEILCSSTRKISLSVWHDILGQVWAYKTISDDVQQNTLNEKDLWSDENLVFFVFIIQTFPL